MNATKAQVGRLAKKMNVSFEVERDNVGICAPRGFRFSDTSYGNHYSDWPVGPGEEYTKAYVYECCMWMLQGGIEPCDCDQCKEAA